MNAWNILTDATIKAVLLIVQDKNIKLDNSKFSAALKTVMKENIPNIMDEWKDAVRGKLSEAWLR